jgi:RNA polymerase sigma-70 factor (ECF subfamily)
VLATRDAAPVAWLTVSATGDEGIDLIHWVLNPAKLARIASAVEKGGAGEG